MDDQTTQPADDRYAALEARIANLQTALTSVTQRDEIRTRETQAQREAAVVEHMVTSSAGKVEAAQRKLAAAYESGEAAAIAAATAEVSAASAEHIAAKMQKSSYEAEQRRRQEAPRTPPAEQAPKIDSTNLQRWRQRNADWYGVDQEMTDAALEADRAIRDQKVLEVGSEAYFKAIDARLRARFPDRMPAPGTSAAQASAGRPTAGAGAGGAKETGRIPEHAAEGFRRMGFDMDDPDVVARLLKSRQVAVQKGLLPEKPINDRVFAR